MPSNGKRHSLKFLIVHLLHGKQLCMVWHFIILMSSTVCWRCHRRILHNRNVIKGKQFSTRFLQAMMRSTSWWEPSACFQVIV